MDIIKNNKKLIFAFLFTFSIFTLTACGNTDESSKKYDLSMDSHEETEIVDNVKDTSEPQYEGEEELEAALKRADIYANQLNMSKNRLFHQLTSEHGDNFSEEAAKYAVDNVVADWKENAYYQALVLSADFEMSNSEISDYLSSEEGEQFSEEEVKYAIDKLGE